jgi:hypothetical protein
MNKKMVIRIIFFGLLLTGGEAAMASGPDENTLRPGKFSLSWSGGLQYGSRKISFDGEGKLYFAKGDTINEENQPGVGVFVLQLQNSDLQELRGVVDTLCNEDIQSGGPETVDPPSTFSVTCLEEGEIVSKGGSQRLIPQEFVKRIFEIPMNLAEKAWDHGLKLIKLDFETSKIERKDGYFFISVRFMNSGRRWVKFKTPDQWHGNEIGGILGVAPYGVIGNIAPRNNWGFALAGKELINRDEYSDGIVTLGPGESTVFRFKAVPNKKITRGEYEFSGAAFLRIEYEGFGWGLDSQVDFRPIKTRVIIDRDYPSTPQERELWEVQHRADMSFYPVKPGETFVEEGLYRAERLISGGTYRSLQVMPFKGGDIATTDAVKMPMESGNGININGPVQWIWEGSAPQPVEPFATEYVDGTQHHSTPGASCPRSGRWVARTLSGRNALSADYRYDLSRVVTLQRGQKMPSIQNEGEKTEWEWVGA